MQTSSTFDSRMAAYGPDAEKVSRMFLTIGVMGLTNAEELALVMHEPVQKARELGISYDDLADAMATITNTAGSTAVAAVRLCALLGEMLRPTDALSNIYKMLGSDSGQGMVKAKGFAEALISIGESAQKSGKSMSTVFGSVEAYQAFIRLTLHGPLALTRPVL